ncbi:MAG TPA: hypothetical protein VK870_08775 [Ignavibacteriaceae bacterium]|nr:hypothetical protein [Ignavibacteriaceae bacterium]
MKRILILLSLLCFLSVCVFGQAIPKQFDYQGVLKTSAGGIVPDGNYPMTFRIYNDPTGGTALWTETQTVAVANGIFSVHLGSNTAIAGVPFNRIHFLGITLGTEPELLPRTMLTPSPYSFMSMDIMDEAVTTTKIQNGAVTGDKIGANQVVKSINGLKDDVAFIAGTNITLTPSGNNITINAAGGGGGGTVTQINTGAGLTGGPITTTGTISIPNDGITNAMLQSNSVTSAKITDGTIATADLANNSVTSAKILDGTIAAADLASNSVTTLKIADNNVTAAKILDEPGYNYNNTGNSNNLYPLTASGQSFTSVTLNAPAAGFAVVYAHAEVFITHTSGTMDNIILKVSRTSGDITTPSYGLTAVRIPAAYPTSSVSGIVHGASITAVFSVTAGNNTFHLNAYRSSGASSSLLKPEIAVIFVPTRYGTGAELNDNIPVISDTDLILGQ